MRILLALIASTLPVAFADWTDWSEVKMRRDPVVAYRAVLSGENLVIEVRHSEGWHTYALDNLERARERSGKETPETELPTRIAVAGGLRVVGPWLQSSPKDLSQTDINWFTWGFEGTARFAAKVERTGTGAEAVITINAQACNASTCAMVDRLEIKVPLDAPGAPATVELKDMVEGRANAENEDK